MPAMLAVQAATIFTSHLTDQKCVGLQIFSFLINNVTCFQLPTRLEKDAADRFSRPEFLGQCVQRDYSPGPAEVVLLQGQLQHVQEDVRAEEEGDEQGL
jgi:hypothetical protein